MNRRSAKRRTSKQTQADSQPAGKSFALAGIPFDQIVSGGCAALLVAGILQPTETGWLDGNTSVYCLSWIALVAVWFGGKLVTRDTESRWHWIDLAVLAFITWVAFAVLVRLFAEDANGRTALNGGWQWVAFGAGYLLVRQLFSSLTKQRDLIVLMIGTATFLGACGLFQFFYELPQSRAEYENASEAQKQEMLRASGIPNVDPDSRTRALFESRLRSLEPMATFGLANSLACLLSTWMVMAAGMSLAHFQSLKANKGLAIAWMLVIALIAFALMLTKSRTAYLSAALGVLLIAWFGASRNLSRPKWIMLNAIGVATIVLLAVIGVALQTLDVQIVTEALKSFQYRIEYWQSSVAMILDAPLFGCGPGGFQDTYTLYKLPQASETVADPHNFVLEIAATCGLPATLIFTTLTAAALALAFRSAAKPSDEDHAGTTHDAGNNDGVRHKSAQDITSHKNDPPSALSDLVEAHLWIGAVLGIPFGLVIGRASGYQMSWAMLILGLLAAIPATFVAGRLFASCTIPRWLLGVTLLVMLTNLLAAGGATFLGVSQSLVILLAGCVGTVQDTRRTSSLKRAPMIAGLAVSAALAIGLQQTMLLPVMQSRSLTSDAEYFMQTGRFDEANQRLDDAIQADPWGGDAWRLKAFMALQEFQTTGDESHLDRMQEALDQQIKRRPRTSQLYREIGDWYLMAYGRSKKLEYAEASAYYYNEAIQRFPNNGWLHAQLAYAYSVANDPEAADSEAAEALRLDSLTPHIDLKLANRPIFLEDGTFSDESTEQLMQNLRIR